MRHAGTNLSDARLRLPYHMSYTGTSLGTRSRKRVLTGDIWIPKHVVRCRAFAVQDVWCFVVAIILGRVASSPLSACSLFCAAPSYALSPYLLRLLARLLAHGLSACYGYCHGSPHCVSHAVVSDHHGVFLWGGL